MSDISVPIETIYEDAHIQFNHIDGPLLTWAGHLHWLTLRERFAVWRGNQTANSLAQNRWGRSSYIDHLDNSVSFSPVESKSCK